MTRSTTAERPSHSRPRPRKQATGTYRSNLPRMRVCLVASEFTPFAKTGGLGDVAAALARYLHACGHDVRPFLPLYGNLNRAGQAFAPVGFLRDVPVKLGAREFRFSVLTTPHPDGGGPVYFVDCPALFGRPAIYSNEGDEYLRFALLSHAALISCQWMGFSPHVVHCNDWHTGLVPLLLKTEYAWDNLFASTRSVLTIHNLAYQGVFPARIVRELSLAGREDRLLAEDLRAGRFGFLATGIMHADAITAVSATYAREILSPIHGLGLDPLLRMHSHRIVGIVNGIDDDTWNPREDPHIEARYSTSDLTGKRACRDALLAVEGLAPNPSGPVYAVVSRLTAQKGLDLIPAALAPTLEREDARFVALGKGSDLIAGRLRELESAFPRKVRFHHDYDVKREHQIVAGADAFLMPSLFEPCGLPQMYSLRYGTIPIVHRTGGLADTVTCYDPDTGRGHGIVFDHPTVAGLRWAIEIAAELFQDRPVWRSMQQEGMEKDNSWNRRIHEYETLYRRVCGL